MKIPRKMIRLQEYDVTPLEPPAVPLKEWRTKFEANNLIPMDLMQYFQASSPFFFTIDQGTEIYDLGEDNNLL